MKLKLNWGKLASTILVFIAGGGLTAIVPDKYKPIAVAITGVVLAAHPSPVIESSPSETAVVSNPTSDAVSVSPVATTDVPK